MFANNGSLILLKAYSECNGVYELVLYLKTGTENTK